MKRDWRSNTRERLREVHHTREDLPENVKQLLADLGKLAANQARELDELKRTVLVHSKTIDVLHKTLTED